MIAHRCIHKDKIREWGSMQFWLPVIKTKLAFPSWKGARVRIPWQPFLRELVKSKTKIIIIMIILIPHRGIGIVFRWLAMCSDKGCGWNYLALLNNLFTLINGTLCPFHIIPRQREAGLYYFTWELVEEHVLKMRRLCKRNCKWQNGDNHVLSVMGKAKIGSHGVTWVTLECVIFTE